MNIIRVQGFFENILAVHKWIYYYGSLTFFHFLLTIADFYLIFNLQFKCTFMERTFYLAPIGLLEITGSEQGISGISFADHVDTVIENPVCLRECVKQLHEYFDNSRKSFDTYYMYTTRGVSFAMANKQHVRIIRQGMNVWNKPMDERP